MVLPYIQALNENLEIKSVSLVLVNRWANNNLSLLLCLLITGTAWNMFLKAYKHAILSALKVGRLGF